MSKVEKKTTVGTVDQDVLAFTAGQDILLDLQLIEVDCLGSAAHVTGLSQLPLKPKLFSDEERKDVIAELVQIMRDSRAGDFEITLEDQDVHLAVEKRLTLKLGVLGKRIHTGRSRNDQVAVDLRLHTRQQLLEAMHELSDLAMALLDFAKQHEMVPMVGRTHLQKAMPSSVGLWASSFAEGLIDDLSMLRAAYDMNDASPLGAAASYGVPLALDREKTSAMLGFTRPVHNVLYAINSRGKVESVVLSALVQPLLTLSRLAEDLIIFSMPEFGYFSLPDAYCTGSSIMPQKKNPDVLELMRAKAARVMGDSMSVATIVRSMASGYNRDLQETKEPLLNGLTTARASFRIMTRFIKGLGVNKEALLAGFTPEVFATDKALELVLAGQPFRDAYHYIKEHVDELDNMDVNEVLSAKTSLGTTGNLEIKALRERAKKDRQWNRAKRRALDKAFSRLLGVTYPSLEK